MCPAERLQVKTETTSTERVQICLLSSTTARRYNAHHKEHGQLCMGTQKASTRSSTRKRSRRRRMAGHTKAEGMVQHTEVVIVNLPTSVHSEFNRQLRAWVDVHLPHLRRVLQCTQTTHLLTINTAQSAPKGSPPSPSMWLNNYPYLPHTNILVSSFLFSSV